MTIFSFIHFGKHTHNPALSLLGLALFVSANISAEITEIPPEEMTEAYIKDTTVIVRKQAAQPENKTTPVHIRVSPLKDDFSEGDALAEEQPAMPGEVVNENQYLGERLGAELANQPAYSFSVPGLDPNKASRDEALRSASIELEKLTGQKIDLNNPGFPAGIPSSIAAPNGIGVGSSASQFVISIPNSGNYPVRNYATPGGEYEINVTPDTIDLRLNVPRQ